MSDILWILAGVPATICLAGTLAFMHGPFGLSEIFRTWAVIFFGGAKWAQVGVTCIVCLSLWAAMAVAAMVSDAVGGLRWSQYWLLVLFYSGSISFHVWHFYTGFSASSKPPPPSARAVKWTKRMRGLWGGQYVIRAKQSDDPAGADASARTDGPDDSGETESTTVESG